ncbi:MAG: CocE/NonD family hydrolase [Gemmatimonadota bacterium]
MTTRREFTALLAAAIGSLRLPSRIIAGAGTVHSDIMVPMRDGVRLATDAYIPDGDGQWPVILERTPYGKATPSRSERTPENPKPLGRAAVADFFVWRGYVVVYQDCRGRYKSDGEFVKYLSDGNDGYDTCEWILKQPWCNGRIGTMGLSYAAHAQGALGSAGAPGVTAMFLDSGGFSNAYQGGIRQGGAFELKQATWAFNNAEESPEIQRDSVKLAALKAIDIKDWFRRLPWKRDESPVTLAKEYEDYLWALARRT